MEEPPIKEAKPKRPTVKQLAEDIKHLKALISETNRKVDNNRRILTTEQNRQRLWIEAYIDPILKDYRNDRGESVLELFQSGRYK
jgi:hypothetical protein